MNIKKLLANGAGSSMCAALLGAFTGCTTYVEQPPRQVEYYPPPAPPPVVEQPPPPPVVEAPAPEAEVVIRTEADFYQPLDPYGRWVVVGTYGRCWAPARVEASWRPYCNGHWQRCDAGWYWVSEEPWGWATYHYGRWDWSAEFGWFWVPHIQWAPAWVSWHRGGGYVGWAPLAPAAVVAPSGVVEVNVRAIQPRAYVFVEERRFLEPVRPTTVVVNNTTIINKTVNITNVKVVNNTVINEGPRTQIIEQASGRKVQAVPVHELRRKSEAAAVARQPVAPAVAGKPERPPAQANRPPAQVERPPGQANRPPAQVERPPGQANRPPAQVERPPAQANRPPAQVERPPAPKKPEGQVQHPPVTKSPPQAETARTPQRPPSAVPKPASEAERKPAVSPKHERIMHEQSAGKKSTRPEPKDSKKKAPAPKKPVTPLPEKQPTPTQPPQ